MFTKLIFGNTVCTLLLLAQPETMQNLNEITN